MAQGSGELRDPLKHGDNLLFTTFCIAKANCHRIELEEAKHRSNEEVVHLVKVGGSGELLVKYVIAESFQRFKETLNKCLKKRSIEIC